MNPGLLTTVQDMGRTGYQQFGVSVSGLWGMTPSPGMGLKRSSSIYALIPLAFSLIGITCSIVPVLSKFVKAHWRGGKRLFRRAVQDEAAEVAIVRNS